MVERPASVMAGATTGRVVVSAVVSRHLTLLNVAIAKLSGLRRLQRSGSFRWPSATIKTAWNTDGCLKLAPHSHPLHVGELTIATGSVVFAANTICSVSKHDLHLASDKT